ncbi:uncharacterized protein LOC117169556 [Belonocnema kinseyi]|uniref:uncharacterized protein LOC117169556 n=1 Tax=Belonocnema kinseyi TaxID=2817044 RepID=UPI00143DEC24|nr:uncharacterized protein LOC117169556 [Belonocnema kinseyi]
MKNFINTLLFPIAIFLKFGELNAVKGVGESSGYGRERQGLRRRVAHQFEAVYQNQAVKAPFRPVKPFAAPLETLETLDYMSHDVKLRVVEGKVTEVIFEGNQIPRNADFFKEHNCLVRLAKIKNYVVVIYMTQNEALLGARPMNPSSKFMEPNYTKWYLAYEGHVFIVEVRPTAFNRLLPLISDIVEVKLKNGNRHKPFDPVEPMQFSGIRFVLHKRLLDRTEITGVTRP